MDKYAPRSIARTDPELAFHSFVGFNGHHFGVFRADSPGAAPWEMHPDTDEFLHVLDGSVSVEVYGADGNEIVPLEAGDLVVVPRGRWHRHVDAVDLVEMYFTPGESLHSDDPAAEPESD